MVPNGITGLWARTALLWFVLTMVFGMYLGLSGQLGASSAHARLGLLGWLSPIAFAFLWGLADPEAQLARRAQIHWAIHHLGMMIQVTGLWMVIRTGDHFYGRMIGLGGLIIILATLWLVTMLWPRLGRR